MQKTIGGRFDERHLQCTSSLSFELRLEECEPFWAIFVGGLSNETFLNLLHSTDESSIWIGNTNVYLIGHLRAVDPLSKPFMSIVCDGIDVQSGHLFFLQIF